MNSWTNSEDQKVSSECWSVSWSERSDGSSEASEGRSEANPESSSEAVFRSFRRTWIIFRSCVQKLQKDVQKRTHNHLQKLCSEASEGRSEALLQKHSSEALFRSTLQLLITVLMIVQKVVHKQTQNHQEHEEHAKHTWHKWMSRKVLLHGSI